jgi:prepilin-type N-terminal cleavage/methylation domain-containing protein
MKTGAKFQKGFTLIEIAIVVLILSILLGYTVALFPKQQELRKYREVDKEMDQIIETIIGYAQINGRLPCPSAVASAGLSSGGGGSNCTVYGGFVPSATLGITGRLNGDSQLSDPWNNPYRYYVTDGDANDDGNSDFVVDGQIQVIGLDDNFDASVNPAVAGPDNYIDLDGQFLICDAASTVNTDCSTGVYVFGQPAASTGPFSGAPFVLVSLGKNGSNTPPALSDELENKGATTVAGYVMKATGETTFVKRPSGFADDFDDIIKWVSPGTLFSKMIEAEQLP